MGLRAQHRGAPQGKASASALALVPWVAAQWFVVECHGSETAASAPAPT